jgi:hypothetical protein
MPPKTPTKPPKSHNIWNQCSVCNFIITKSANEQHECFKVDDSQTYVFKNVLNTPSIMEHSKGNYFVVKYPLTT